MENENGKYKKKKIKILKTNCLKEEIYRVIQRYI